MEVWLAIARGPLLTFAFAVFFLGLLRQVGLTAAELVRAYRQAGDRTIPVGPLLRRSLGWLFPVNALRGRRAPHTAASAAFHLGILLVPIFLDGHVQLIRRGLGLIWPALPSAAADLLALTTLAALVALLLLRLTDSAARALSGVQDWLLLVVCVVIFLSGFAVAHPVLNPLPYSLTYLIHLLSAELLLVLVPFSKLVHIALFPLTQLSWELGWHFVPGAGEKIRTALGKEGEPI
jgi:nitrate reductase gamma subunit